MGFLLLFLVIYYFIVACRFIVIVPFFIRLGLFICRLWLGVVPIVPSISGFPFLSFILYQVAVPVLVMVVGVMGLVVVWLLLNGL